MTRDDKQEGGYGDCFWTDQKEMIQVYNQIGGTETLLSPTSEEYHSYISIHNNRAMTMARVGMTPVAIDKANEMLLAVHRGSVLNWNPAAPLEQLTD